MKDPQRERVIFSITLQHFEFKLKYIMYFLLFIIVYLSVTLALSLSGINKVHVDTVSDTIKLKSLFTSKTIAVADISKYTVTVHRNRAKVFSGLLLKLCDGKKMQVVEQNVHRVSDLKDYLSEKKVPQGIGEKMKFPFN
jgi:hypothetical protein